jgi:hypothetical protein
MKYSESGDERKDAMKLDEALSAALERKNPPLGFAQRVEMRIAEQQRENVQSQRWKSRRGAAWPLFDKRFAIAAALLLAIVLPLGWRLHHQAEVARGEAAKQQVMLALRITGTQLRSIEERTQPRHSVYINAGPTSEGETR